MGRGSLDVVEVEFHGDFLPADITCHQDVRNIIDIHFEGTEMAAHGKKTPWQSEEGVEIIHLIDLREERSPTLIASCGIGLPVILVRMPPGHVFTPFSTRGEHPADSGFTNDFLRQTDQRMKTHLIGHESDPPPVSYTHLTLPTKRIV